MSQRKPISPEAKEAVNQVIRKFCEDMERRKVLVGVLAELNEQPRQA